MAALIFGDVLAVYVVRQYLNKRPAVSGQVNRIIDSHPVDVAALVLRLELRPAETHTKRVKHRSANGAQIRRGAEQLLVYVDFVAGLGNALKALLVQLSIAKLPLHAWEVDSAVLGHQRRSVELH
ncbi:hypothetical protein ALO79_200166 [Pseudomonas syringae pv. castaneae]|uniref:Uncharacterized protein n=1 Tax=Pseudomonas syringae pv. castaneae TaxID=264450 RepID=A0A0P9S1H9_PSESX|nr:hypothetical protein ALO79_200166 [Pseudomonas syringae pv. castaneae]